MKRKTLVAAREKRGWNQQLLADHVYPQVSKTTVSNWECALKTPRPHYKGELCRVFGFDDPEVLLEIDYSDERTNGRQDASGEEDEGLVSTLREEELHESMMADPEALLAEANTSEALPPSASMVPKLVTSCVWRPSISTLQFIASDPARHFWQIAHTDYSTYDEMKAAIVAAIREMNMMGDTITRRDALCELASIPMISLGKTYTLRAQRYEEMLRHYTAALEGCWELYRDSDPIGVQHAFDCVYTYVPLLETIARDSSRLRSQALDLATRYAILKTLLGWNYMDTADTVTYAQEAVDLSNATGDILLQLSARTKLSWSLLIDQKCTLALDVMKEGEYTLKEYQRKKGMPPLLPGIIGNFYSSYSIAQTENGIDPDRTLGVATESSPLQGHIAFIEFTTSSQCIEAARIYSANGNYQQTMHWLQKRIDPKTFAPRIPQSERGRIQSIALITRSYLQSPNRDMGEIIRTWKASIEGANTLKCEDIYRKAMTNFAIMRTLWPSERVIRELMPLTSHWRNMPMK